MARELAEDDTSSTLNHRLLQAARFHQRDDLFLTWRAGGWGRTADWQADRCSIRSGLVLSQTLRVGPSDRVALWLPMGPEWAFIERGLWGIGAVSVPVRTEWKLSRVLEVLGDVSPAVLFAPDQESVSRLGLLGDLPESLRYVITIEDPTNEDGEAVSLSRFMEQGGVLDTPERANMWRATAREIDAASPASLEFDEARGLTEMTQAAWHGATVRIRERFPAGQGHVQLLAGTRADVLKRALLYSAWADGQTTTLLAGSVEAGRDVAAHSPQFLFGAVDILSAALESLEQPKSRVRALSVLDRIRRARSGIKSLKPPVVLIDDHREMPRRLEAGDFQLSTAGELGLVLPLTKPDDFP